MVIHCLDNPIEIDEYYVNNEIYIDCEIRKQKVILNPEEKVRQAFILNLFKFSNINSDNFTIKVEYKNLDIVIYKKHVNKDFQPAQNPILIIELKRQSINILNFKDQLLDYLKLYSCDYGILSNCKQLYLYSKINEDFIRNEISLCELEDLLQYDKFNNDISLFNSAINGNLNSFLKLIEKFGKTSKFTFQCSGYSVPIEVFWLSHSMDYIFYDHCGCKSRKKRPKIMKTSFIKLISIQG